MRKMPFGRAGRPESPTDLAGFQQIASSLADTLSASTASIRSAQK